MHIFIVLSLSRLGDMLAVVSGDDGWHKSQWPMLKKVWHFFVYRSLRRSSNNITSSAYIGSDSSFNIQVMCLQLVSDTESVPDG